MERSEAEAARPKVVLIGGDGGRSGVPRHLEHLVRACGGQARFLVLSAPDRGGYSSLRGAGVRHIAVPGLASRLRPWQMLATARWLTRLLRRETPDLVWAHARMGVVLLQLILLGWALRSALPGARGRALPAPTIAITYHGLPFGPGHRRLLARLALWLERLSLRHGPARCLIFLSVTGRDAYVAAVGAGLTCRHRLEVLANSSTVGPLPAPPAADRPGAVRRILVTGRVARQKNLDRALHIFAALPGSYRLSFCGEGTETHAFRQRARRILGNAGLRRIDFNGPLEDLRPWLATADCYLLTSRYEGQPIGALEAFEAGLPMALPDLPGCREVARHHPHARFLTGAAGRENPAEDALRIVGLAEAHARARPAQRREIRDAWERHHGFAAWSRQMEALMASLLPSRPALRKCAQASGGSPPLPVDGAPPAVVLPFPSDTKGPTGARPGS
ncbi:glycosyltransferase family 4 protein [Pseudooceanicola marinus]|uniref:glycosyltransferase family 4 protein n=1 Tax=Pseudooceanicola marinus TaxID=396013 RepID=UPI001CD23243|nr:glycosyltransferase [Pseudooceanicola marinus]MCA1337781.1 glycosyltransferase [Pseudooceanicola marinus]